jgi:hypothetical protein
MSIVARATGDYMSVISAPGNLCVWNLTLELSRAAKRHRLERIVRQRLAEMQHRKNKAKTLLCGLPMLLAENCPADGVPPL